MSVKAALGGIARKILDKYGFRLIRKEYGPFGISVFDDVERIGRAWDLVVRDVFDVGANVGEFAEEAHRHFPAATVRSFEPHPASFAQLRDRKARPWLVPVNCALGEVRGETRMFVYEDSKLNSLVANASYSARHGLVPTEMAVRCDTIDDYCASAAVERVQLLKIDTEGADLAVLRGARRMLGERRVDFIYVEFNDLLQKGAVDGGALQPIAEFLAPFGYECLVSYVDYLVLEMPLFKVCNALFVLPPATAKAA